MNELVVMGIFGLFGFGLVFFRDEFFVVWQVEEGRFWGCQMCNIYFQFCIEFYWVFLLYVSSFFLFFLGCNNIRDFQEDSQFGLVFFLGLFWQWKWKVLGLVGGGRFWNFRVVWWVGLRMIWFFSRKDWLVRGSGLGFFRFFIVIVFFFWRLMFRICRWNRLSKVEQLVFFC